jgi:hypothetical protein
MAVGVKTYERSRGIVRQPEQTVDARPCEQWTMPPLDQLPAAKLTLLSKAWMLVLRGYLVVAAGMLIFKLVQLAISPGSPAP